jgi:site-specific recombinase XerD
VAPARRLERGYRDPGCLLVTLPEDQTKGVRRQDAGACRDGLIFTSSRGEPWRRGTFAEIIRDARAKAGLPESVTFHHLRHRFASVLIGAGCSIKAVKEALGHANASETLDTYSHLWPSDDDRIRDAIQSLHVRSRPRSSADSVTPALHGD